ncbi:MAG: shikimate dehydrogenase family protein [Candidatus Binatia bacterium]
MRNSQSEIAALQACVRNRLDPTVLGAKKIVGVIGDAPSLYSKSPALWNTVFQALELDIIYAPLDVDENQLADLLEVMRASPRFLGANVTVPYKIRIISHLDDLEEKTRRINAVNTVVRTVEGKLIGYNTDGEGFLASLLETLPGQKKPFMQSLAGLDVLLIGAGGAARAVAFALGDVLSDGKLIICNRSREAAKSLARDAQEAGAGATAISETDIAVWAPRVGMIVNSSVKGQEGWRKVSDNKVTLLEPYSGLAAANPSAFPEADTGTPEFYRNWLRASLGDIESNNRTSLELACEIPSHVVFCDLIYAPPETVFLRHGRYSGHRTLNGKGMIIAQAAQALFHRIARQTLERSGRYAPKVYQHVLEVMFAAW